MTRTYRTGRHWAADAPDLHPASAATFWAGRDFIAKATGLTTTAMPAHRSNRSTWRSTPLIEPGGGSDPAGGDRSAAIAGLRYCLPGRMVTPVRNVTRLAWARRLGPKEDQDVGVKAAPALEDWPLWTALLAQPELGVALYGPMGTAAINPVLEAMLRKPTSRLLQRLG